MLGVIIRVNHSKFEGFEGFQNKHQCEVKYKYILSTIITKVDKKDFANKNTYNKAWFKANQKGLRCVVIMVEYNSYKATFQDRKEEGCERIFPTVLNNLFQK